MKNNEITVFNNPAFGSVRVSQENGEPWFVAKDVCDALNIVNSRDVLTALENDEKGVAITDTPGGKQKLRTVNEAGLYSLIFKSRKKEAKEFKRWVTHEVLPAIRKHGAYMTPAKIEEVLLNPDTIIQLATNLKLEQEKNRTLTAKIEADKPKTIFADAVATSKSCILIGELAKILTQNGYPTGQKRLFAQLRNDGYLHKSGTARNMPLVKYVQQGLFEVKETAVTHSDGHVTISKTTKVTGKGQQYFINKFLKRVA